MFKSQMAAAALIAATVAGCDKTTPPTSEARPVRAVAVRQEAEGEIVSLTGQVRAEDEAALAFRLEGRMIERPVHVGDDLSCGEPVAHRTGRSIIGPSSRKARAASSFARTWPVSETISLSASCRTATARTGRASEVGGVVLSQPATVAAISAAAAIRDLNIRAFQGMLRYIRQREQVGRVEAHLVALHSAVY